LTKNDLIIFGGTFDPVHHGHLIVAQSVAEQKGFGRVALIPAATPPHKPAPEADGQQRLEMLRLAVEGDDLFEVRDLELRRPGPSYTMDTVEALRDELGDAVGMHLLIGADMVQELPSWHRAQELVETVDILIAQRGSAGGDPQDLVGLLERDFGRAACGRLREGVLATPRIDISSTDIRRRLRGGLSVRYLVPEAVDTYLGRMGLYAGPGKNSQEKTRS